MGGSGQIAPMPRLEWVEETVLTGEIGAAEGTAVVAGATEVDVAVDAGTGAETESEAGVDPVTRKYPVITGDYRDVPAWRRHPVVPGTIIEKPSPIFQKLDVSIVEEELARYSG